ncbi:MAG: TolC family protein [Bacteroidales bacterium]|nr:TolC family protein [Bacteroidales bacterium]MDD2387085.1 TolC family protein [Bacteroidales bacterium]MDD4217508.1 TolC family protein [Bacteroidales bacterium]MDY0142474.1 TolC family protein [Bacteroidales bacterium]
MKFQLLIFFAVLPFALFTQSISLDSCLNLAEKTYPLRSKEDLLRQSAELNNQITKSSYYPSLKLNAQATWQTDVTMLVIDNLMFDNMLPEISKDQYNVYAELNQTIWDGGMSKNKRELENAGLKTQIQQVSVDIFNYKTQLVDLYFAVLNIQKQIEILQMKTWQIDNVIGNLRSAIENNIAIESQLDILLAEKMMLSQKITELRYESKALIKLFSKYCNSNFDENIVFLTPTPELNIEGIINRPELTLFDYNSRQILAGKELLKSGRNPKILGFARAGYGRPGLNMMSNEFEPYAIIGAKFVWTPWEWNKTKKEIQILEIKSDIVRNQQDVFLLHQNAKIEAQKQRISKIEVIMKQDENILELRESITSSYRAQLTNGVIKSSDYLNVLNDENTQRLNMELHQLMLFQEIVKYNLLKGEIYE